MGVPLALPSDVLGAAVSAELHFRLCGAVGDLDGPDQPNSVVSADVIKFDVAGNQLQKVALPTERGAVGVHAFFVSGASFAWDVESGTIAIALARTMTQSSDGANHQGGIAFLLNATTLEMHLNYGQTASHSFGNSVLVSKKELLWHRRRREDLRSEMILGISYPSAMKMIRAPRLCSTGSGDFAAGPPGNREPAEEEASVQQGALPSSFESG
ncbi:unnamed protein product [Effrenium voratum]|nr:unnamed protein product [Effrenium voratum]